MSIEMKEFDVYFKPKDKAFKKCKELKNLVIELKSINKDTASVIATGKLAEYIAENYPIDITINDFFSAKVWECSPELPRPAVAGEFCTDFFGAVATWNEKTKLPEPIPMESLDHEETFQQENVAPTEQLKTVGLLGSQSRAASLVLFGPVRDITAEQYGQIIDLNNDDVSSPFREQAEAISKEPRVLALLPEKQTECLAWVRQEAKPGAKWPDYKNLFTKWLDTPPAQREPAKADNGATGKLSISDQQQRNTQLRYRVAAGILSRSMDLNIHSPEIGHEMRINTMLSDKNDTEVNDWFTPFSRTPGVHDFDPASIGAIIKSAPDKLHIYPGELRKYIDKCISDFDCINPPPLVVDIACGRSSAPLPQKTEPECHDKTEQTVSGKTDLPAVCPGRIAALDKELDAAFSQPANDEELRHKTDLMLAQQCGECIPELGDDPTDPKWDRAAGAASNEGEKTENDAEEDTREPMSDREIEIAHALNDLLSGRTDVMGDEEAKGVVTCTGHLIADALPLLIIDITTTEFCLLPDFSDGEIHDVATTILDSWSDDDAVRQKIALDAIVEYRRPEPPKAVVIDPPVIAVKPKKDPEPLTVVNNTTSSLSYQQQLTAAALQGLCANPAYRGDYDDIPQMAVMLAVCVINAESGQ